MRRALLLVLILVSLNARGESPRRSFSLELGAGFPQLLGLQLGYVGLTGFELGLGFGFAPINQAINAKVGLAPVSVDLGLPDPYGLYPSATFGLNAFQPYVRWFPGNGSIYVQLALAVLRGAADVTGDLKNENTGQIAHGALSGTLNMVQTALTLSLGWRPFVGNAFFVNISGGVAWLKSVDYQLNVGGSLADIAGVTSAGQTQFDQKVSDIRSQIDRAIADYRDHVSFLPTVALALGYAF